MSSKQLTAKVRLDVTQAEKKLKLLEKRINKVNNTVNRQVIATRGLSAGFNQAAKSANKLNNNVKKTSNSVSFLTKKVKLLANAYLGVMGAQAVINTSDMITSAKNKLNNLPGGNQQQTQQTMDKTYAASQRSRGDYGTMLSNVSKTMTLAGDAFQGSVDNAIKFQEIMSKAYTVGGASAAEQSSSMYQLVQALGSGILQGDELRSVREGAAYAYKEIEKFAQGIYGAEENLKDLASEGKITSDLVVAAIFSAEEKINQAFENTDMTFAQVGTNIKNTAIKAFEPVLTMLNQALNSSTGQAFMQGITNAIVIAANVVQWFMNLLGVFFTWFADNWYWLQFIVYSVIAILIIVLAKMAAQAIYTGIVSFVSFLMGLSPLYLWIIAIGLVIASIVFLAGSVESAFGFIVGIIMAALSVIWNLFVTLVTLIIQSAILPLLTAWDNFANFFGNLFNDPISAIIYSFENMAQTVLGILKTIANGIDAIFGSNLADAVSGWSSKLKGKADSLVQKYGNGSYEEKSNAAEKVNELLSNIQTEVSWNTGDAYNTGYEWGSNVGSSIGNLLGGIGEKLSGSLPNAFDPNLNVGGIGSGYDPEEALNGIKGDTGDIADSMELTKEDLEYLRRIADMEWKKEFTTAEIKVEMNNSNQINGDGDLDGIVTRLADKLYEEMNVVANGVYA